MPSLVCHSLSFAWPTGEVVFDDLDAAFPDGLTGLVGRNGTGKSTLIKILAGEVAPTGGHVSGVGEVGYLPQHLVLDGERSVASVLGIDAELAALTRAERGLATADDYELLADRWDIADRARVSLAEFGFDGLEFDRRIATLSGGEVILLALSGLFLSRPAVLLLDEPTNNLDRAARQRLHEAVRRWRGPVLVVSHDRELLDLADTIAELRDGSIRNWGGNFTDYEAGVAIEQDAAERALRAAEGDLRRQKRELAEMRIKLDRRQRFGKAQESTGMGKGAINYFRQHAEESAVKLRDTHQRDVEDARRQVEAAEERIRDDDLIRIDLPETAVPAGRDVLLMRDAELRNGRRVDLHLRGPDRVALVGPNGSGKTTMIETICGRVPLRSGTVDVRVPLRLLPQRLQLLRDADTVLTAVGGYAPHADDRTLRAQLARFLLDAATVVRPVATLSGGERFRASLAALLLAEPAPQLLILDEPTNNLDLDSTAQLVAALRGYRGALLVASHDERFLADLELTGRLDLDEDEPRLRPTESG